MMCTALLLFIVAVVPIGRAAIPGTFYWKPRLGLDLAIPTTEKSTDAIQPTVENIQEGLIVLIDGYEIGLTIIAVAAGVSSAETFLTLNPLSGYFYTNVYRWALRYFSLLPFWMSGHAGNFVETHRVWKRRYYYMDQFVPKFVQTLLFFIKKEEWEKEEWEYTRFKKYAEAAFGKHFRFPSKVFNNFKSQMTVDTAENLDTASDSG